MITNSKCPIHMGCGEPLQSRRWIVRLIDGQASAVRASKPKKSVVQAQAHDKS